MSTIVGSLSAAAGGRVASLLLGERVGHPAACVSPGLAWAASVRYPVRWIEATVTLSTTWRALYATTLTLMLCATSSQPALAAASYYPRYGALGLLALHTYQAHPRPGVPVKDMPRAARWLTLGMGAAVALGLCSTAWSVDPLLTLQQAFALAALAGCLHALLSRRWVVQERVTEDMSVAFWVLAGFFALGIVAHIAGVAGTQSVAGYNGYALVDLRYQGLANNPNMLAVLCAPTIPLGWYLYRQGRQVRYLVGTVPAVASVLMSQSRTTLVAVVAAGVLMLARRGPGTVAKVGGVGLVLGALAYLSGAVAWVASSALVGEISDRFASREGGGTLNGRSQAWSETGRLIWERPSTGYGYSAGPSLFEQLRSTGDLAFGRDVVHNSYLQWFLETGVLGVPALVALVAACALAVWKASGRAETSGLAWCVLTGLIVQFTESAMLGTGQAYPLVFWVAAAGCALAGAERRPVTPAAVAVPVR